MATQLPPDVSRESKGVGSRRGPEIKLEHILMPVDFSTASRRGVAFAAGFAARFHATMRLLHVVEMPTLPQWGYARIPMREAKLQRHAHEKLRQFTNECDLPAEVLEQTEVRVGSVASEICASALEQSVDLITMPAHGPNGFIRFFVGSVTESVARCAPCPVLVMRNRMLKMQKSRKDFDIKRIIVPTDFSDESKKAFPYATALAQKFGATIALLYVVPTHLALSIEQLGLVLEEERLKERARKELPRFRQAELDAKIQVSTMVREGGPAHEICRAAEIAPAGLIIMSTHGHTGFKRFMLGSVTARVLRHAPCPVLVVREREHEFLV